MVREDLVEGAISFLQDPSVASAPIEQRIAFLRSKNLTQEEIDTSLARVGQAGPSNSQPPLVQQRQPPPQYNSYPQQQYGYAQQWQQPPPEVPQRDWREYFIAATVVGGVGYGLYWTAKRYIYPLIAPPTPPQLEQDKASVDASFDKAFALLEQLANDTQELKDAESARKERLDSALAEVESVVARMKQVNEERELESKRIAREISEIREQIPRAIEKERDSTDNRLKDLNAEMKSLKTLVSNRMQAGASQSRTTSSFTSQAQPAPGSGIAAVQAQINGRSQTPTTPLGGETLPSSANSVEANGLNGSATATERNNAFPFSNSSNNQSSYNRLLSGRAAIPDWQKKKGVEEARSDLSSGASTPIQNTSESGTVTDANGHA